jgi:hypothetical protein
MEVHMRVQARPKPVDESDCADLQGCLIHLRGTRAVDSRALRNDSQEQAPHHIQHHLSCCMKYLSRLGSDSTNWRW